MAQHVARMLACAPVEAQTRRLVPPGGLFDEQVRVISCPDEDALLEAFAVANRKGNQVTLLGGARSFGTQFLPTRGGIALDVSLLGRNETRIVEHNDDRSIWVCAGGGMRFCDLHRWYPGYRVLFPPTSDRVTLAGALGACSHNTRGYFASEVRAFRVVTASGQVYEASASGTKMERQLFEWVPGAFGALGTVTQIELRLYPIAAEQLLGVVSLHSGTSRDGRYLDVLEAATDNPRFAEGAGAVVYGNRGHAIVFGDELLPLGSAQHRYQAILTDDAIEEHAFTQGLANRFPRLAEWILTKSYPEGRSRWAPWYGFQFFHRGFDRSFEVLGRKGVKYGLSRMLGVDRKLPVFHQAWFFPREQLRPFMSEYFRVLDRYPGIERRSEQQDLVLLPRSRFPAHSMGETKGPVGVLTASYSVAGLSPPERDRIAAFFREVSRQTFERFSESRVSLCKQVHCDPEILRTMHCGFSRGVRELRKQVDPDEVLHSRHLAMLL